MAFQTTDCLVDQIRPLRSSPEPYFCDRSSFRDAMRNGRRIGERHANANACGLDRTGHMNLIGARLCRTKSRSAESPAKMNRARRGINACKTGAPNRTVRSGIEERERCRAGRQLSTMASPGFRNDRRQNQSQRFAAWS